MTETCTDRKRLPEEVILVKKKKKGSSWHKGGEADAPARPLSTYYVFSGGVSVSKASATLSQYVMQKD